MFLGFGVQEFQVWGRLGFKVYATAYDCLVPLDCMAVERKTGNMELKVTT